MKKATLQLQLWALALCTTLVWDDGRGEDLIPKDQPSLIVQLGVPHSVDAVAFTGDGQRAILSGGRSLHFWNVEDGKQLQQFANPSSSVGDLTVSPDGKFILSGGYHRVAELREISTGRMVRSFALLWAA